MDFSQSFLQKTDLKIVGFAVAGIVLIAGSYFSGMLDSKIVRPNSHLELIGQITPSGKDIRLKPQGSLSWTQIRSNEDVYDYDQLFTGKKSGASVRLEGMTEIEVAENSMVSLQLKMKMIDISYGQIIARIGQGDELQVRSGNEVFVIDSKSGASEIRVISETGKKSKLQMIKGQARITEKVFENKDNPDFAARSFSSVESVAEVETEVKPTEVLESTPASQAVVRPFVKPRIHRQTFIVEDSSLDKIQKPVRFVWSESPRATQYTLVLTDRSNGAIQKVETQELFTLVKDLAYGDYSWHVEAQSSEGEVVQSDEGHILVRRIEIPKSAELSKTAPPVSEKRSHLKKQKTVSRSKTTAKRNLASLQSSASAVNERKNIISKKPEEEKKSILQTSRINKAEQQTEARPMSKGDLALGIGYHDTVLRENSTDIQSYGNSPLTRPTYNLNLNWRWNPIYSTSLFYENSPTVLENDDLRQSLSSAPSSQKMEGQLGFRFLEKLSFRFKGLFGIMSQDSPILVSEQNEEPVLYRHRLIMYGLGIGNDYDLNSRSMIQSHLMLYLPYSQQVLGPSGVLLDTPYRADLMLGLRNRFLSQFYYGVYLNGQLRKVDYSQGINSVRGGSEQGLNFLLNLRLGYEFGGNTNQ